MRERPGHVADTDVLAAVRAAWDPEVTAAEHLPVGFGAHHWVASADGSPRLFVTLDALGPRHTGESLEGAYAGAALLFRAGLEFVVPCRSSSSGSFTVPFAGGALSATSWVEGTVAGSGDLPDRAAAEAHARILGRLHAATPPALPPRLAPAGRRRLRGHPRPAHLLALALRPVRRARAARPARPAGRRRALGRGVPLARR